MRPPGWAAGSPPLPQPIGTAGTRKYKRGGGGLVPRPRPGGGFFLAAKHTPPALWAGAFPQNIEGGRTEAAGWYQPP